MTDLTERIVTTFQQLRGWGEHTDPRLHGLNPTTELPLLVVAAVVVVGADIIAALDRLEGAMRVAVAPVTEDEVERAG